MTGAASEGDEIARAPLGPRAPARFAAYLGALCGIGLAVLGVRLLFGGSEMPRPLGVGLVLVGAVELACGHYAVRRARAAWAFALSTNGAGFLIFLFGAPKLRDAAEISIALALVPAALFAVVATLYALSSDDY